MVPVRSPHPEWSPARGLSRAALWLLIKSPFCLILWAAFLVITEPAATWIATHAGTFWILPGTAILATAVAAIPALPCGHLLARRLTEQVGFEGPVPAGLGIFTVWVVVLVGKEIALMVSGSATWVTTLLTVAMGLEASLVVLWRAWVNPD